MERDVLHEKEEETRRHNKARYGTKYRTHLLTEPLVARVEESLEGI